MSSATIPTIAYAAQSAKQPLEPFKYERRAVGPQDVLINVDYCGVCHSDIHTAKSEWSGTLFPCIAGHEILGKIEAVGNEVKEFSVGETAAVGCLVNSCKSCENCKNGEEQYCNNGALFTYNSRDSKEPLGHTSGGYSDKIVVNKQFVLKIKHKPEQLHAVAPLLCAGITTYSPLKHWKAGPGKKVGVVGIGGLGHMAVKLSHALGAYTVAFTTSEKKRLAAKELGADEVIISSDSEEMKKHANSFDLILNSVCVSHKLDDFTALLKLNGTMVMLGVPEQPHPSPSIGSLIFKRRAIAGSLIGGIAETQEMLDFCAERNIVSDVEMIPIQKINEAYERMIKGDVKYRFVIENKSLKQ